MNNKLRQLILVLGIMFVIGAATGITVQQILISQINQTNGENFTKAVMPLDYVINSTAGTWKQNANRSIELTALAVNYTVTVNRSYVKDTVYQNTNSTAMFMSVTAYTAGSGTEGCNYKTGSTNPPTDMVGNYAEANADMQSFWVLPQHYFAAFQSAGTCTIMRWSVWQ